MELIITVIVVCIVGVVFGLITQHISESKGYSTGFAWGFWLGWLGVIVVALKPNIKTTEYHLMYPNAQPAEKPQWTCVCGAKNSTTLSYCIACRRTKDEAKTVKKKACPHCGASNNQFNKVCFACNRSMVEESHGAEKTTTAVAEEATAVIRVTAKPDGDSYDALEKLHSLHERGILTDEEYVQKKAKILENM